MWTFADAANLAAVEDAARAAHALKGSAAMMGYSELGELAAHAERLLLDMLGDLAQRVG